MSTPDEDGLLGGSIQVVPRLHGSCGRKLIEALLLDTALRRDAPILHLFSRDRDA